jgi:hypothetical protein
MDVLRYIGIPDHERARVQAYFSYITQFNHPSGEGLAFLSDLPRTVYDQLAGEAGAGKM